MASLSLDQSETSKYIRFVGRFVGTSAASTATMGPIRLKVNNIHVFYQVNTILKHLVRTSEREDELMGFTSMEKAQIAQWMSFALKVMEKEQEESYFLQIMDNVLMNKTYMVSNHATLADAALFWIVYKALLDETKKSKYVNVLRWFYHMQHTMGIRGSIYHPMLHIEVPEWRMMAAQE